MRRTNIKMTESYAKLAGKHIMKTGSVSREIRSKLEPVKEAGEDGRETKDEHIFQPRMRPYSVRDLI